MSKSILEEKLGAANLARYLGYGGDPLQHAVADVEVHSLVQLGRTLDDAGGYEEIPNTPIGYELCDEPDGPIITEFAPIWKEALPDALLEGTPAFVMLKAVGT